MLESLSFVDEVRELPPMSGNEAYDDLIKQIHPSVIACTEGDPILEHKIKQAEQIMAKAVVIPKINTPSTSQLAKLLGLEKV